MTPRHLLTALLATVLTAVCLAPAGAQAATPLPDGRVYELVSPAPAVGRTGGVFPLGAQVNGGRPIRSAASGHSVIYAGEDYFEPSLGSIDDYVSTLTATNWATNNVTPPVSSTLENAGESNQFVGVSPDASAGIIATRTQLTPSAPAGYTNLYLTGGPGFHELRPLVTATPPHRTRFQFGWAHLNSGGTRVLHLYPFFAGGNSGTPGSPAFSHLLFAANDSLAPPALDPGKLADNLYESDEGKLRLINILPDGTTTLNGSFGVDHNDEFANVPLPNLSHVISDDGSRVFWTDENTGDLYVREGGERTRSLDAAVGGGGEFQTASTDGSRVLFTKEHHLYEFNLDSEVTTDLTPAGGVEGILGASDDATAAYFVSVNVLAPSATEGQPNLYLERGGATTLVATLDAGDNETPELTGSGGDPAGDWYRTFAGRSAMVSPNGRYAAFMSIRSLTGYDNTDAVFARKDYEVFLYDSSTSTLACASCKADGSQPTASTVLPKPAAAGGFYQQRYLNDNGQLFLSTADGISTQDVNRLYDVYEYEGGHASLLSPAGIGEEAVFGDASENGSDVFFTTDQPLVPADGDQIIDLYDARVGGRPEPPPGQPCSVEACLGSPVIPPPSGQTSASAAFFGPATPPRAAQITVTAPPRRSRAQQLRHAMTICRRHTRRVIRIGCEKRARRRYGPHAARSTTNTGAKRSQ